MDRRSVPDIRKSAEDAFASGWFCAESVVAVIAKAQGVDPVPLQKAATAFCSGVARTSSTCGALTGAIMGVSLALGRTRPDESVQPAYSATQRLIGIPVSGGSGVFKPYYQDDKYGITIYHGDCRDILPQLEPVDLVLTDPPYFLPVQSYVGARGQGYRKRMIGDLSILQTYFDSLFDDLSTILRPTGTYYIFCDAKSYPIFWRSMFPLCKHVRLLIWDKIVSFNGYTWRHQHELISWGELEETKRVDTGDGDIIKCRGVLQEDRDHPAEKPEQLLKQLISKHETSSILDPFMGSGTTLVAAKELGRKAIGIEIEEKFCEIAVRRLQQDVFQWDTKCLAFST